MPTALTTATAREDLIEATILLGALAAQTPPATAEQIHASQQRLPVLTARYLNTVSLHPDTAEEQHDELHAVAVEVIEAGIAIGLNATNITAWIDGTMNIRTNALSHVTLRYLAVMYKLYNLERATDVLRPQPPPKLPNNYKT